MMTRVNGKQKLLYAFIELAKTACVDFILNEPEQINDEQKVLHLFVLAADLPTLKQAWMENKKLGEIIFWQDAETEGLDYLQVVHPVHLCLNGSTWLLPGFEDMPMHQGQFLVIHPLSCFTSSSWSRFKTRNRYSYIQKALWQKLWEDRWDLMEQIVDKNACPSLLKMCVNEKTKLEPLLEEKAAYINSHVGELLAYYDLWGYIHTHLQFTKEMFTKLAKTFTFLKKAETFTAFLPLWDELASLNSKEILAPFGIDLPQVEADLLPIEVEI